ncbi:MAG: ATP-binding cassette domain-containing protein [Candidatus Nanopelagicales bacterium]|jgi:ABC-type bacteriocin/lantibiotic exporter with double-glycine peptidase domain|nr:ATP-binding cassette domain-containing protein [Candidatus Nanopelagicales bacterium]
MTEQMQREDDLTEAQGQRTARLSARVATDAAQLHIAGNLVAQVQVGVRPDLSVPSHLCPEAQIVFMAAREVGLVPPERVLDGRDIPQLASAMRLPVREVDLDHAEQLDRLPIIVTGPDGPCLIIFKGSKIRRWRPEHGWDRLAVEECPRGKAWAAYPSFPSGKVSIRGLASTAMGGSGALAAAIAVFAICVAILSSAIPIVSSLIVGNLLPEALFQRIVFACILLVLVSALTFILIVVQGLIFQRLLTRASVRSTAALWDRVLLLDARFFRRFTAGELNNRVLAVDRLRDVVGSVVVSGLIALIVGIAGVVMLLFFSRGTGWPVVIILAVIGGYCLVVARRLSRHERDLINATNRLEGLFLGLLEGIDKVRVSAAGSRVFARWSLGFARQQTHASCVAEDQRHLATVGALLSPVLAGSVIVVFVMNGSSNLADFAGMTSAAAQVAASFSLLVPLIVTLSQASPLLDSAKPVLEALPDIPAAGEDPGDLDGKVEFTGVEFGYTDDMKILKGVSFTAEQGSFVAIIGRSGSGKSTLFRLLLGFETPEAGSILVDGRPVNSLDMRAVRRQMGVVLQKSQVPSGSLILVVGGNIGASEQEVWEALRAAGMEEDVRAMPMGLHTIVSEGGTTFSGGQIQRLMIARALMGKPKIILFDEATSALDNETQSTVSESVARTNATRLVIAHRLTTIQNADKIVVLEGGVVVEQGTFEELMNLRGFFWSLAERQLLSPSPE